MAYYQLQNTIVQLVVLANFRIGEYVYQLIMKTIYNSVGKEFAIGIKLEAIRFI